MQTRNQIVINGSPETIFQLAAEVERWPEILPHYRKVVVLDGDPQDRLVQMQCVRPFGVVRWPCRWKARQQLLEDEMRILYTHVAGPTRGMEVEWRLEATGGGVLTTITHSLGPSIPLVGSIYSDWLVGPIFVHDIAGRTLRTIKNLVEAVR
jgi:ribosome-associated toxin RatA of RatAB toxin-antitoxin module